MNVPLPAVLADHVLLVCAGLLAAAALAVPARALLRRDPVTCYRLLFALLIGAVAVVPIQWFVAGRAAPLAAPLRDWIRARSPEPPPPLADPDRAEPAGSSSPSGIYLVDGGLRPRDEMDEGSPARDALPREVRRPEVPAVAAVDDAPEPAATLLAGSLQLREERPAALAAVRAAFGRGVAAFDANRADFANAAALLWIAGVGAVAARRLLRFARTLRLISRAREVTDPGVLALWRRVVRGSRVADRVRLVESDAVASPACAGLVRRVVILPAGARATARAAALAPGVLEWALRHELVHLERGDAWASLFQSAVTALLWFHPAAWWLSSEIGRWRELSCDRQVVEGSGRRKSYALALLEYAASASSHFPAIDADPHSAGVRHALLHWSRSPSQIRRRIEMLTVDPASLPRARRWLGALVAGGALAVPVLAQVAGAATLLPSRPVQETTRPAPPPPPTPPAAPATRAATSAQETTPVPAPPALAPRPAIDTPAPTPAPRGRRHVTVPAGVPPPRAPPQEGGLPPPAPALAPPAIGVATATCVDGDGDDESDDVAACAAARDGDDGDDGDDDASQRIANLVQEHVKVAQRQIEQAVRQAQRGAESRQRDLQRELDKFDQQAERERRQGAQRRESLQRKLADVNDDDRRAELEAELAELDNANHVKHLQGEKRRSDLQDGLAALEDVNFDACRESLDALDEASALDAGEMKRAVAAELAAERQSLQATGDVAVDGGDGDAEQDGRKMKRSRDVRAAVERALAESRAATDRACERAAEAVAHARERGALSQPQQEQVERALAQARKVDMDAVRAQVERALATAQQGMKRVPARPGQRAADPATAPRPAQAPKRPGAVRFAAPLPPTDTAPEDPTPRSRGRSGGAGDAGGGDREAMLRDRIKTLEAQLEALRDELEAMRQQQAPAPPPARHGRALR